jgi:hypothetical protein
MGAWGAEGTEGCGPGGALGAAGANVRVRWVRLATTATPTEGAFLSPTPAQRRTGRRT